MGGPKTIFFVLVFLVSGLLTGRETILVSIAADGKFIDDTLYTMNPDGSGSAPLFNFHNHPRHNQGRILQPRIAADGKTIYFSSDNSYAYTPANRNIFRITSNGTYFEQLTPGPNSGKWGAPCPCGSVRGKVKRANGVPYGNSPVFLEGVGMVYSKSDGSFNFDKVPEGKRYIVAYRPGTTVFDSQLVFAARGAPVIVDLIPNSDYRWNFTRPVLSYGRIYHISGINTLQWQKPGTDKFAKVYTATGSCTGLSDIDGFDTSPKNGWLAIMDYQEGCPTNRGLYVADGNGGGLRLLLDLKSNNACSGAGEVFWSPDESKIAIKIVYNWQVGIFVIDVRNGGVLGYIAAANTNFNLYNTHLYGWSPDGRWLLYSQYLKDPSQAFLFKVRVTSAGAIDQKSVVTLLSNVRLSGATWGRLL